VPAAAKRAQLVGLVTGAVIGAIGRVVVTSLHLAGATEDRTLILLTAAVAGMLIGALASLPGRPLMGALVGVVASAFLYLGTLPVVLLFHLLRTLTAPSLLEVTVVGAIAGGVAGLAAERVGHRSGVDRGS